MVNLTSQRRRPHISDTRRPQKAARQKMTRLWRAFRERVDLRQSYDQISSTSPLLRISASVTFQMAVIIEPFLNSLHTSGPSLFIKSTQKRRQYR
ncbi:MAG: hypothetical protein WBL85_04930 [Sedimentisphaerales bacterium]